MSIQKSALYCNKTHSPVISACLTVECQSVRVHILSNDRINLCFRFLGMSTATFGQKRFTPVPPDKGSFPLDHESLCKTQMVQYMKCLQLNRDDSSVCRQQAKQYLECRMENNLMAKEEWKSLGFNEPKDQ